jgi:predicted dehydrogenase
MVSDSRRRFIGRVAGGMATAIAAPQSVVGANERIRLGIIGPGDRGMQIVREALNCANTEFVGFADIYTKRLEAAKAVAPNAKTYLDYRYLLEDKSIDAVLIATPQHLHCEHFVATLDAGKHVYQEKTMAFTVDHAKRMRAAYEKAGGPSGKRIVQIGHQSCSSGQMTDALNMLSDPARMGKITAIHSVMYRNTPHGKPQWSRPVQPDMTSENIVWKSFLGDAPPRDFDANRYLNWRFFWDYSGGNVYENMCHQLSFWYRALDLKIPAAVTMRGGVYLWKDGREVPDTMSVAMEHLPGAGKQGQADEMLFSWASGFGNNQLGSGEDVLGTDGTISKSQQIRYLPQKVNRPQGLEMLGSARSAPNAHMANFLDAIRGGVAVNCPFEVGYRVSIACRMAVDSYRLGRTVKWDPAKEEAV